MLRMNQFRSGREVKDYYTAALEGGDYYITAEQQSQWRGELAKHLGLEGLVTRETFARLADNQHPLTGDQLTPRNNSDRTVAYDMNFHVPKGVSLLHLVSGDDRILGAIQQSTTETMREIEKLAQTRVRTQGQQSERMTGSLLWGEFLHTTTRPVEGTPDPHLHIHCFVFNATFDGVEERVKAAHFRDIKRDMPYFEAAFHSRLAWRLESMGFSVERHGEKQWDIVGIPESAKRSFSRRTTEITKLADKLGITDAVRKAELGARSRSKKTGRATPEELRREWLSRMTADERKAIEKIAKRPPQILYHDERAAAREGLDRAMEHRFVREAVVAEPRLLESALRMGLGRFRPESLHKAAQLHPDLLRQKDGTLSLTTTRQVLAEERAMLEFARNGKGVCASLEGNTPWRLGTGSLNKQQTRAVEHLLKSRDRVMLLRGKAGVGKTTLLREIDKALNARGHRVVPIAPTSDASRGVLRDAGFADANTVKTFLDNPQLRELARGGVLWVDEAGLIGTPTMNSMFAAAKSLNARVILCGDTQQHAPVERGDALRLLESRIGLVPAELSEVMRQQGTYKEAVELIASQKFDKGIAALDKLGAIRELPGNDWVPLVTDYLDVVRRGQSAMVISPTHAEGNGITSLVRAALKREGVISQDETVLPQVKTLAWTEVQRGDARQYVPGHVVDFHRAVGKGRNAIKPGERFEVLGVNDKGQVRIRGKDGAERDLPLNRTASFSVGEQAQIRIAVGETIRMTGGGRTADGQHRLNTGAIHRIAGFSGEGNLVLDNGWQVSRDFGKLDHGYVSTSHAAQGRTVDWVFIAQGRQSEAAASAEQVYVSVSRGKQGVRLYVQDRTVLLDAFRRMSERRSAVELMSGTSNADKSRQHAVRLAQLKYYERQRTIQPVRVRGREYGYGR